jgi:hypothetical protein
VIETRNNYFNNYKDYDIDYTGRELVHCLNTIEGNEYSRGQLHKIIFPLLHRIGRLDHLKLSGEQVGIR